MKAADEELVVVAGAVNPHEAVGTEDAAGPEAPVLGDAAAVVSPVPPDERIASPVEDEEAAAVFAIAIFLLGGGGRPLRYAGRERSMRIKPGLGCGYC